MSTIDLDRRVYAAVRRIPAGNVATYGDIARAVGCSPRQVGFWLNRNPDPASIPCHRVVFANGALSDAFAFGGKNWHAARLRAEGVHMVRDRVDLVTHRTA